MRIDQAIFTSIQGGRLDGYQLAARSSGITSELERELVMWGPAHDSLWDTRRDARSINFHPLSPELFCLSCTTSAGEEYSGRGGARIYTQMFILPYMALAHFANDPFLVLRALSAAGRLVVLDRIPDKLPSVPLLGRSEEADPAIFARQIIEEIGQVTFDHLVEAVLTSPRVAVLTSGQVERLFQAVLHALPIEQRLETPFTTGLKDSPRRPFKLLVLPSDPSIVRLSQRLSGARIVDLAGTSGASVVAW